MYIKEVIPSLIKDSKGDKTFQIEIKTYNGKYISSAPSGTSKGKHEVANYNQKGIEHSLLMMRAFSRTLEGKNFIIKKIEDLKKIVVLVKKFESKYGRLGGNVTYALESAFLKAAAADCKKQVWEFINDDVNEGRKPRIPMPVGNCIGGGLHTTLVNGKKPDFQEFSLIPLEKTFSRAVTVNLRAYEYARKLLKSRHRNIENAWMTDKTNEEILDILKKIRKKFKVRIGVDFAASTFYDKGYYKYKNKNLIRDKVDQADYMERLINKYRIFYAEDIMNEEDFSGFKEVLNSVSNNKFKSLIIGDDLTTTNLRLVRRAVNSGSVNAVIIKPNQIGSILEVRDVVKFCKQKKIIMIFSHRSGETMDDILADYCVGFGGQFIKTGIYGRERLIKLKRIIDIEKYLKKDG